MSVTEKGKNFVHNAPSLLQDRFQSELAHLSADDQSSILGVLLQNSALKVLNAIILAGVGETFLNEWL